MRSSELAALAGVTVRALRHYHQLGILDEPVRSANGYRTYTVHHLVRVLRIKRLSSLGFPLHGLAPLLDDDPADGAEMLDRLDAETAAEIDRLVARRDMIAQLKRWNAAPDLPDALAPYAAVFAASVANSTLGRFDREQAILISHLAGAEGAEAVSAVYARFSEPDALEASIALTRRLESLEADAAESEITALVDDVVTAFAPLVEELRDDAAEPDLAQAVSLVTEYANDVLNPAQQRVIERVEARLAEPPTSR